MDDIKMCKALEAIARSGKVSRLNHVYCKDGYLGVSNSIVLVMVQSKFCMEHGYDHEETIVNENGMYRFKELEWVMPDFKRIMKSSSDSGLAHDAVEFNPKYIRQVLRVFDAYNVFPMMSMLDNNVMHLTAYDRKYSIEAVIMGIRKG